MSNLIEQYGSAWFVHKFGGSYFMRNDEPHMVINETGRWRTMVPCFKLAQNGDSIAAEAVQVPANEFTDVGKFSVPNLGWRTKDKGKFLAYFQRNNNSYHRGLSDRNLSVTESSMTRWLRMNSMYNPDRSPIGNGYTALMPEFTPLTEGIRQMRAGEIISFAASPTIAVIPDVEDRLAILFKTKRAGTVMPDNTMTFIIPEISNYMENT